LLVTAVASGLHEACCHVGARCSELRQHLAAAAASAAAARVYTATSWVNAAETEVGNTFMRASMRSSAGAGP
jgi:hypothetical protein